MLVCVPAALLLLTWRNVHGVSLAYKQIHMKKEINHTWTHVCKEQPSRAQRARPFLGEVSRRAVGRECDGSTCFSTLKPPPTTKRRAGRQGRSTSTANTYACVFIFNANVFKMEEFKIFLKGKMLTKYGTKIFLTVHMCLNIYTYTIYTHTDVHTKRCMVHKYMR